MSINRRDFLRVLGIATGTAAIGGFDLVKGARAAHAAELTKDGVALRSAVSNRAVIGFHQTGSTAAMDLRGQTYRGTHVSPDVASSYQYDLYVEDFESVRRAMGAEKVNLFGYSHCGYFAAAYALAHPERVSSLVLAEPALFNDPAELRRRAELAEAGDGVGSISQAMSQYMPDLSAGETQSAATLVLGNYQSTTALAGEFRTRAERPITEEQLAKLQVPVLLVGGTKSHVADTVNRAAKAIPFASVSWIEGANHVDLMSHAERIAQEFVANKQFAANTFSSASIIVDCAPQQQQYESYT